MAGNGDSSIEKTYLDGSRADTILSDVLGGHDGQLCSKEECRDCREEGETHVIRFGGGETSDLCNVEWFRKGDACF